MNKLLYTISIVLWIIFVPLILVDETERVRVLYSTGVHNSKSYLPSEVFIEYRASSLTLAKDVAFDTYRVINSITRILLYVSAILITLLYPAVVYWFCLREKRGESVIAHTSG
ncbi:MAG TPA: hypothetical protein PLN21_09820 [Gemmatales bacterium]|nr:hypothetical protein [Gemmatales bacterium]